MWTPLPGYAGILFVLGLLLFGLLFACGIAFMFARGLAEWALTMLIPSGRRSAELREAEKLADIRRRREEYESRRREAVSRSIKRQTEAWLAEHPDEYYTPEDVARLIRDRAWSAHPYSPQDY